MIDTESCEHQLPPKLQKSLLGTAQLHARSLTHVVFDTVKPILEPLLTKSDRVSFFDHKSHGFFVQYHLTLL
jgi:hypothetical protein